MGGNDRERQPMQRPVSQQYHVVLACFLGWTIDAFDFFIMVFVVGDVAREFGVPIPTIAWAFTLTLALRVLGALIFGRMADYFGRKPALIANVLAFTLLEVASGFAPNLTVFLLLRALYGVAMGGEWGIGASLTMESIPVKWRGPVSGLLQSGYSVGYLFAALLYGVGFDALGWRGMFVAAAVPGLLVLYIRRSVPESPAWERQKAAGMAQRTNFMQSLRMHWGRYLYAVILMTAAATFSHGTQDLYPVFLREQHHLSVALVSQIAIIYNVGAILGCFSGGSLSQLIGRRRQVALAALMALILLPLWATASGFVGLALTSFLMQFLVQCSFGVMPAHLNEISPADARATFPGFTYQFGNMAAAGNAPIQAMLAVWLGYDYGWGLGIVVGIGAACFCLLALGGAEARTISMSEAPPVPQDGGAARERKRHHVQPSAAASERSSA
jgi:MFS transporter, SHS family, lactate transporter